MSAPQDDENFPKVKRKAMKTGNIAVIVKKAFITSRSNTFFLPLHFCPFQRAAILLLLPSPVLHCTYDRHYYCVNETKNCRRPFESDICLMPMNSSLVQFIFDYSTQQCIAVKEGNKQGSPGSVIFFFLSLVQDGLQAGRVIIAPCCP